MRKLYLPDEMQGVALSNVSGGFTCGIGATGSAPSVSSGALAHGTSMPEKENFA